MLDGLALESEEWDLVVEGLVRVLGGIVVCVMLVVLCFSWRVVYVSVAVNVVRKWFNGLESVVAKDAMKRESDTNLSPFNI